MRIAIAVTLALLFCAGGAAAREKQPDYANVTPGKNLVNSFSGALDAGSGTYDRIYTDVVTAACGSPAQDSSNDGMAFELVCLEVSDNLTVEIVLDPALTNIADTVITLYCDPFDPVDPAANVIAFDDDGGVGTLSAITAADDLQLVPGQEYWLVISTFGAGMYGDFSVQTTENVQPCGSVPLENRSWGAFKSLYR